MKQILNTIQHHLYLKMMLYILLFTSYKVNAQINLVPNHSFENYTTCPSLQNSSTVVPKFWYIPTTSSLCYLNSCSVDSCLQTPNNCYSSINSFQIPKTGNAYIIRDYFQPNFSSNTRTYIQCKLIDSFKNNKYYYAEFFVSLVNKNAYGCNNVAMYLSNAPAFADTSFYSFSIIPANPQVYNYNNPIITDTLSWVKVSGIYKAHGGEQYITLGNFKPNNQTSFKKILPTGYNGAGYYIDDVSVIPLDSFCLKADAGRDTAINAGDSVFIGSYTNGIDTVRWLNGSTVIDSTRPGFWVKPTVTTTYILHQIVNGCYSSDTVTVNVTIVPLTITSFSAFATPLSNGEGQGVRLKWQTMNEVNVSHYNVQRSTNGKDFITVGKVKANNKVLNEYQYSDDRLPLTVDGQLYYRIVGVDVDGKMTYSEVRTVDRRPLTVDGISMYPNPATNQITVLSSNISIVSILDITGREVLLKKCNSENLVTLSIGNLKAGVYIVKVVGKDGVITTSKLIVE